ncbi:hypothetical protein IscW_ISCW012668 [Ixodes scapularis]|uniref:Uncharacterized protein n=1 Tax=Ixodes scapularis TaxID=6945 RepID=B7QAM7_IXOSC|nr:hypothetical protein IscW_ISCW012668 [Ixodes scapularis]|eukprot:XP_002412603.1 hypothetical protein IscW_ISCW012668 [Ixodes scapularis]
MIIALSNGVKTMEGPVLLLFFFFFSSLRIFFGDLFREHVDCYMMLTALCHNLQDQFFFSCKLCFIIALTLYCPLLVTHAITARFLQWQLLVFLSGEIRWRPYAKSPRDGRAHTIPLLPCYPYLYPSPSPLAQPGHIWQNALSLLSLSPSLSPYFFSSLSLAIVHMAAASKLQLPLLRGSEKLSAKSTQKKKCNVSMLFTHLLHPFY